MGKKVKRIYVDTSVVYGAPAREFSQDTRRFWDAVRLGEIVLIVSDILKYELEHAPQRVRDLFDTVPTSQIEYVVSTDESDGLAEQYVAENVVGKSSLDDCKHIALATLARADALVSWNFKHIVDRREGYNSVNKKWGYPEIEIQNPKKLMEVHDDET